MLTKTKTIDTLILAGNEKNHIGKAFLSVFPSLSANKTVTALDINGNKIGDKAAISLAESIRTNVSLKYMTWDRNDVDLGGFQAIASSLKTNKVLMGIPPPVVDLETALNATKEKKRTRERLTAAMNHIQVALAANRGESPGPEFIIPTTSNRRVTTSFIVTDRPSSSALSVSPDPEMEEMITIKRKATGVNRRESMHIGLNNLSTYTSPLLTQFSDSPPTSRSPSPSRQSSIRSASSTASTPRTSALKNSAPMTPQQSSELDALVDHLNEISSSSFSSSLNSNLSFIIPPPSPLDLFSFDEPPRVPPDFLNDDDDMPPPTPPPF